MEQKKPPFERRFDMSHVPPPDPTNFWVLELNDPRVVLTDQTGRKPKLTITVRKIKGTRVSLQISYDPEMA